MGVNGDRANISNAVVGSGGVAGIKIKGDNIHVNIAEHENTSSVTPFDPTRVNVDNAVVGGFGVAGLDIQGNGIDFNIGHDKPKTTTTADGVKPNTNPADGVKPNTNPADGVKPNTNPADGVKPNTNPADGVNPNITSTKEDVKPKTTTGAGVSPKPDTLPNFAQGPMYVTHVPGRSISFSDDGFEIICAGCGYEAGKHWSSNSKDVILQNIRKGLHVMGSTVLEQPKVKPLSIAVEAPFGIVTGKSIKLRDPPGQGFDIICPTCAVNLGIGLDLIQINAIFQGKHVHEKEVNTTTTIKLDYGDGPIYISHIQGHSIAMRNSQTTIICPGCCYQHYIACAVATSKRLCDSIILVGLHVHGTKVFEQENVKPLPSVSGAGYEVLSPNIGHRDPPSAGFDVICSHCAAMLANNGNQVLSYKKIIQGQHAHK